MLLYFKLSSVTKLFFFAYVYIARENSFSPLESLLVEFGNVCQWIEIIDVVRRLPLALKSVLYFYGILLLVQDELIPKHISEKPFNIELFVLSRNPFTFSQL